MSFLNGLLQLLSWNDDTTRGGFTNFCNHLFFFLQSLWRHTNCVIRSWTDHNNVPLTYVYPDTIKTCLTPNHLLFGRQLLYSSNTTPTVVRNLTVLSSTTDKLNRISNHFLDRWRHEYVVNLRETQRTSKLNINSLKINVNGIVLNIYEEVPWRFWRIAVVTRVLPIRNSEIKEAIVRIAKTNTTPKRPLNNLFSVENIYHDTNQTDKASHREIASPFPCCPGNREYLWKKTQIEKKSKFCFTTTKNRLSEYDGGRTS